MHAADSSFADLCMHAWTNHFFLLMIYRIFISGGQRARAFFLILAVLFLIPAPRINKLHLNWPTHAHIDLIVDRTKLSKDEGCYGWNTMNVAGDCL